MAVTIEYRLSGGAGNSSPAASLGGAMSSTAATGSTLFDTVGSAEASAGDTEYRCIYVANTGTTTATSVVIWVQADTTQANTTPAIALGGEGPLALVELQHTIECAVLTAPRERRPDRVRVAAEQLQVEHAAARLSVSRRPAPGPADR